MSRVAVGMLKAFAAVVGVTASMSAAAVPIDYTMGLIKGTLRFDSSGPGSGAYSHEVINVAGVFEDGLNEYLPIQPAGQQNASSSFVGGEAVTMDWFEIDGIYAPQSFGFVVRNFVDNSPAPAAMGLRSYVNVSFVLDLQATFYDINPDDPSDIDAESVAMDSLEIALFDVGLNPLTLNPGGWFLASYELSALDDFDRSSLQSNQRIIESSFGEGFLLTATVPDVIFNPISIDPNPDPTSVPEPGTLALLGLGLLGLGAARRRRSAQGSVAA